MNDRDFNDLTNGDVVRHRTYGQCVVGHPESHQSHGLLNVLGVEHRAVWLCKERGNGLSEPFMEYKTGSIIEKL